MLSNMSKWLIGLWLTAGSVGLGLEAVHADIWCCGYFPGWEQSAMPASNIDFSVITHVIHFSVQPNSDGSLNTTGNGITKKYTTNLVALAHAAKRQALICVGGAGTSFQAAVSNNLTNLVSNLTNFMAGGGYDGIDVDWEPLDDSDKPLFTNFVTHLRTALNGFSTHKLLTTAIPTGTTPSLVGSVQSAFDQINLMTYDLSGPYGGWVTWHNAPIYNSGIRFQSVPTEYVPSIDGAVTNFIAGGVATNKLGVGIPFYGYVWQGGTGTSTGGVTGPNQGWSSAPTMTAYSYNDLMSSNFAPALYHFDTNAQAPYYSITNAQAANDMFISFNDPRSCAAIASYTRNRGLGGFIIWELAQDHKPGKMDPLLQAIKGTLTTPGSISLQRSGQNFSLSFTSAPLGSYQIQWTTNLAQWNSLLTTNVGLVSTGGVIQVSGSATGQVQHFYRVKTIP